jgi:hypothetical protein
MSNLKISQLTDGSPAQTGDQIPINRAGTNFRVNAQTIITGTGSGSLAFGANVTGLTMSAIRIENAPSGDNDLFTVPAGSRAFVIYNDFNTAGTTTTYITKVKISGVYYQQSSSGTRATLTGGATGFSGLALEAGQTFAINYSQSGMNLVGTAFVFPNTSPIKTALVTSLASGDNTVYTCPAGKKATVLLGASQILGSSNAAIIGVVNNSGGSLNYFYNIVASGGSPGTANKFVPTTAIGNGAGGNFGALNNWTLNAGDYVSVNASGPSAGIAWVTVQEN